MLRRGSGVWRRRRIDADGPAQLAHLTHNPSRVVEKCASLITYWLGCWLYQVCKSAIPRSSKEAMAVARAV